MRLVQVEYYPDDVGSLGLEPECKMPILPDDDNIQYDNDPQLEEPHRHSKIADSLAQLGFYARSMKPLNGWEKTGSVPFIPQCADVTLWIVLLA